MEKELKITKERVLEAAKHCTSSKSVLEKLFPEAFEEKNKYIKLILRGNGKKEHIQDFIDLILNPRIYTHIPGVNREEKAEHLAKLIYETYG